MSDTIITLTEADGANVRFILFQTGGLSLGIPKTAHPFLRQSLYSYQ